MRTFFFFKTVHSTLAQPLISNCNSIAIVCRQCYWSRTSRTGQSMFQQHYQHITNCLILTITHHKNNPHTTDNVCKAQCPCLTALIPSTIISKLRIEWLPRQGHQSIVTTTTIATLQPHVSGYDALLWWRVIHHRYPLPLGLSSATTPHHSVIQCGESDIVHSTVHLRAQSTGWKEL